MEANLIILKCLYLFIIFNNIFGVFSNAVEEDEEHKEHCGAIHHNFRVECGWRGINKRSCLSRGCCYDSSIRRSLWCFQKDENLQRGGYHGQRQANHPQKKALFVAASKHQYIKSCDRRTNQRENCGWPGISRQVCNMRGCCYDKNKRNTYWCFKSDHLYLNPLTAKILKCTAACGVSKWSEISKLTLSCDLDESCWEELTDTGKVACLQSCKIQESIIEFIANVSQCLHIDEEIAKETHSECDFQMACWIDRHGHSAMECYDKYSKNIPGITTGEISTKMEKDAMPSRFHPSEGDLAQHNQLLSQGLEGQHQFYRQTDISNEVSVLSISERYENFERPNEET